MVKSLIKNDSFFLESNFALPRILFPYITFLGTLYKGEDKTESALAFMQEYMGRVAESYKDLSGLYYVGYRHGLLHTNMPKLFAFAGDYIGWWVSFANSTESNRTDFLKGGKVFYPDLFYKDLCKAINLYIKDFNDPKKQNVMFSNFKKGFVEMAKLYRIKDTKGKYSQRSLRKSFRFLKRPLLFRHRTDGRQ